MNSTLKKLKIFFVAILIVTASFFIFINVLEVHAQSITSDFGLEKVGEDLQLGAQDIRVTIAKIISAVLTFLGIVALLIVLYGGAIYMTAGGDDQKVATAKKILINGAIGLVIIMSSYAITSFVLNKLSSATGYAGGGGALACATYVPPGCTLGHPECCGGGTFGSCTNLDDQFVVKSITPHTPAGSIGMNNFAIRAIFSQGLDASYTTVDEIFAVVDRDLLDARSGFSINFIDTERKVVELTQNGTLGDYLGDYDISVSTDLVSSGGLDLDVDTICGDFPLDAGFNVDNVNDDIQAPEVLDISDDGNPNTGDITYRGLGAGSRIALPQNGSYEIGANIIDDYGIGYVEMIVTRHQEDGTYISTHKTVYDGPRISRGSEATSSDPYNFRNYLIVDGTFPVRTDTFFPNSYYTITLNVYDIDHNVRTVSSEFDVVANSCSFPDGFGSDPSCRGVGACTSDSDCLSGVCDIDAGVCLNVPIINEVNPWDGAAGNWVTVLGHFFGSDPGQVFFNNIPANLPSCDGADVWHDNWIVAEVPGPALPEGDGIEVRVEHKLYHPVSNPDFYDTTANDRGAIFPGFTKNSIIRPGLCSVLSNEPGKTYDGTNTGLPQTPVVALGKNLGATTDMITFGGIQGPVNTWTDMQINASVPINMSRGWVGVIATVGTEASNGIPYRVMSDDELVAPQIESINPATITRESYVTVVGRRFGDDTGILYACTDTDMSDISDCTALDTTLPLACGDTWTDTQIIAEVPLAFPLSARYIVVENNLSGLQSVPTEADRLNIVAGPPAPSICALTPMSGSAPLPNGHIGLNILGINFSASPTVYFWGRGSDPLDNTTWLSLDGSSLPAGPSLQSVITQIPVDYFSHPLDSLTPVPGNSGFSMESGPIKIESNLGVLSNSVKYAVTDCRELSDIPSGMHCCAEGSAVGSLINTSLACPGETREGGYVWRFTTGNIPDFRRVLEICDNTTFQYSPTPRREDDDGENVCLNREVSVEFTDAMNSASFAGNVELYTCGTDDLLVDPKVILKEPASCSLTTPNEFSNIYNSANNFLEIRRVADFGNLDANTWYHIELLNGVEGYSQEMVLGVLTDFYTPLQRTKPCGDPTAYCFDFKTGPPGTECILEDIKIRPIDYTVARLGLVLDKRYPIEMNEELIYQIFGRGDQACSLVSVAGYPWRWGTDIPASATVTAEAEPESYKATARAFQEESTVVITAEENVAIPRFSSDSALHILLGPPSIMAYWPNCGEACSNASIGARFNREMVHSGLPLVVGSIDFSVYKNGIHLYSCVDENECINTIANFNSFGTPPPFGISQVVDFNIDPASTRTVAEIIPTTLLSANTNYLVYFDENIWSAGEVDEFDTILRTGRQLEPKMWTFKTKEDGTFCMADKVVVTPDPFIAYFVGEKTKYSSSPYTNPDSCSVTGQKLNPWGFGWDWSTENPLVATVSNFTSAGELKPFCGIGCLLKGSDISLVSDSPLCGNGVVDAGELCDDGIHNGVSGSSVFTDWGDRFVGAYDTYLGFSSGSYGARGIYKVGDLVYVANYTNPGLQIIDVTIPNTPFLDTSVGSPYVSETSLGVEVWDGKAYVASWTKGLRIFDVSDLSSITYLGGVSADPADATYDATMKFAEVVRVRNGFAYLGDYTGGFKIIDVSNVDLVPATPIVGAFSVGGLPRDIDFYTDTVTGMDYAYVARFNTGVYIYNITDPAAAFEVRRFYTAIPGIITYYSDIEIVGDLAYLTTFNANSGLEIWNLVDPENPVKLGSLVTPGDALRIAVRGNYAYVADSAEGLQVINVTNPSTPVLIGSYKTGGLGTAREVIIDGNYAYVAYTNEGLVIVDITVPVYCSSSCGIRDLSLCGNGVLEPGEDCDIVAPGEDAGTSCSLECLRPGNINVGVGADQCGNGTVDEAQGEECDTADADTQVNCSAICTHGGSATTQVSGQPWCGSGNVTVGEDCEAGYGGEILGVTCANNCLHIGTKLTQEWCDDLLSPSTDEKEACKFATSVCGNSLLESGEECEIVVGDFVLADGSNNGVIVSGVPAETCSNNCLLQNICDYSTWTSFYCDPDVKEGCKPDCTLHGSSIDRYSVPSLCGDGIVGYGEYGWCEYTLPQLATFNPPGQNPVQSVTAVGEAPLDPGTQLQSTQVETNIVRVRGGTTDLTFEQQTQLTDKGDYALVCGFTEYAEPDASSLHNDCKGNADNELGVGSNSCCYNRPERIVAYPHDGAGIPGFSDDDPVCLNSLLSVTFDGDINEATLADNIVLARGYTDAELSDLAGGVLEGPVEFVNQISIGGATKSRGYSTFGNYLYIPTYTNSSYDMLIVDLSDKDNPTSGTYTINNVLIGFTDTQSGGIDIIGNRMYVAIMDRLNDLSIGVAAYDIDPATGALTYIGHWSGVSSGASAVAHKMEVVDIGVSRIAYITADRHFIALNITDIGSTSILNDFQMGVEIPLADGLGAFNNLQIDAELKNIYTVGHGGGTGHFTINSDGSLDYAGFFNSAYYKSGLILAGNYLYMTSRGSASYIGGGNNYFDGIWTYDISNRANPVKVDFNAGIDSFNYSSDNEYGLSVALHGDYLFAGHRVAPDVSRPQLYNRIGIYNVSNPADIKEVANIHGVDAGGLNSTNIIYPTDDHIYIGVEGQLFVYRYSPENFEPSISAEILGPNDDSWKNSLFLERYFGASDPLDINHTREVNGLFGRAYEFFGSEAMVAPLSGNFGIGAWGSSFSISAWVRVQPDLADTMASPINMRPIIANMPDANSGQKFGIYNGNVAYYARNSSGNEILARGSENIIDGNWHYVNAVIDKSTKTVSTYVDGVIDSTVSIPAGFSGTGINNFNSLGGAYYPAPESSATSNYVSPNFIGAIDEINVVPTVLTLEQISNEYNEVSGSGCVNITSLVDNTLALNDIDSGDNNSIWQKIWNTVKRFFALFMGSSANASVTSIATVDVWCRQNIVKGIPEVSKTRDSDGKVIESRADVYLNDLLDPDAYYTVLLHGGDHGIGDVRGVGIRSKANNLSARVGEVDDSYMFRTGNEICRIAEVKAIPSKRYYRAPLTPYDFTAWVKSESGQYIVPITGVYEWNWSWTPSPDSLFTISALSTPGDEPNRIVSSTELEGTRTAGAHATVMVDTSAVDNQEGMTFSGPAQLVSNFCEKPWPPLEIFPFEDKLGNDDGVTSGVFDNPPFPGISSIPGTGSGDIYFNYKMSYCSDSGASGNTTDDLPYLKPFVFNTEDGLPDAENLKRILFFNEINDDVIGLQIFSTEDAPTIFEKESLDQWFVGKIGQPSGFNKITIDGYEAMTNGSNYYISAINRTLPPSAGIYSNIYVFSINENAQQGTFNVFNQLINSLEFNSNLTDDFYCINDVTTACFTDFDCMDSLGVALGTNPDAEPNCSADKTKMKRDWTRLQTIAYAENALNGYIGSGAEAPQLKSGTYIPGRTRSVWPSWGNLGSEVGSGIGIDPINRWTSCNYCQTPGGEVLAPARLCASDDDCALGDVCVAIDSQTCWDEINSRFICPEKSSILGYTTDPAVDYMLYGQLEHFGTGELATFIDETHFTEDTICKPGGSIEVPVSGSCGNGVVNLGEFCDPPGQLVATSAPCTDSGGKTGTYANVCNSSCTWVTSGCDVELLCGNGRIDTGEDCDDGTLNGTPGNCSSSCTDSASYCGDGNIDSYCSFTGDNCRLVGQSTCNTACSGDGYCLAVNICSADEFCDRGALNNGEYYTGFSASPANSCSSNCKQLGPRCGDGILHAGDSGESCEDGTTCDSVVCNADNKCSPLEECDDGNNTSLDGCTYNCKREIPPATPDVTPSLVNCGDFNIDAGEFCDRGDANGVQCVTGYDERCNYCSWDCQEVLYIEPDKYCGNKAIDVKSLVGYPVAGDEGDSCSDNAECDSKYCISGGETGNVCAPNGYCTLDTECAGSFCVDNFCSKYEVCEYIPENCSSGTCVDPFIITKDYEFQIDECSRQAGNYTSPDGPYISFTGEYDCRNECGYLDKNCTPCGHRLLTKGGAAPGITLLNPMTNGFTSGQWGNISNKAIGSFVKFYFRDFTAGNYLLTKEGSVVADKKIENLPASGFSLLSYPQNILYPWNALPELIKNGLISSANCSDSYYVCFTPGIDGDDEYENDNCFEETPDSEFVRKYEVHNEIGQINNEFVVSPALPPDQIRVVLKWTNVEAKKFGGTEFGLGLLSADSTTGGVDTFFQRNLTSPNKELCIETELVGGYWAPNYDESGFGRECTVWPTELDPFSTGNEGVYMHDTNAGVKTFIQSMTIKHDTNAGVKTFIQSMTINLPPKDSSVTDAFLNHGPYAVFAQAQGSSSGLPMAFFDKSTLEVQIYEYRDLSALSVEISRAVLNPSQVLKIKNSIKSDNTGARYWHLFNILRDDYDGSDYDDDLTTDDYQIIPINKIVTSAEQIQAGGVIPTSLATCGNGMKDTGEGCDPSVLGQENCISDCSGYPVCGDNVIEGGETCDYCASADALDCTEALVRTNNDCPYGSTSCTVCGVTGKPNSCKTIAGIPNYCGDGNFDGERCLYYGAFAGGGWRCQYSGKSCVDIFGFPFQADCGPELCDGSIMVPPGHPYCVLPPDPLACKKETGSSCGNNTIEGNEICDGIDKGVCAGSAFPYCNADCDGCVATLLAT